MDVGILVADMRVHHIGIATDDANALSDLYQGLLDAPEVHREEIEDTRVIFLDAGSAYVEVLEPLDGGTIARFLDNRGPGIHHVAFETPDIDEALAAVRDMGVELVDESPRPGAWGSEIAFLHPRSTGGVLVELVDA